MKDYYELLELSKNASEDTIKKVFRILIKKNHPDLFEGEEKTKAEEKVKELNEAYEVLINEEKRKEYDLKLEEDNKKENETLQTLIEENKYLKSVIFEKNQVIKDFLEDAGIYDVVRFVSEGNEQTEEVSNNINEGYRKFKMSEKVKDMLYMLLIVFVGIVLLMSMAGNNLFEIFGEIFNNMF